MSAPTVRKITDPKDLPADMPAKERKIAKWLIRKEGYIILYVGPEPLTEADEAARWSLATKALGRLN